MTTVNILVQQAVEVEPCPFCLQPSADIGGGSGQPFFVRCTNTECLATGLRHQSAGQAIAAWNEVLHRSQRNANQLRQEISDLAMQLDAAKIGTVQELPLTLIP